MNGQVKLVSARVATEPKAVSPKVNARELESVSARVKNAREQRSRHPRTLVRVIYERSFVSSTNYAGARLQRVPYHHTGPRLFAIAHKKAATRAL